MELGKMSAHHGVVSAHVAAERPTVRNRNDGVSVAPQLNDAFYHEPQQVKTILGSVAVLAATTA
jgi:predicted secreted hydrolase